MWYLYLDESGDLGFDFVNKKPSKNFTVTILALNGVDTNRKLLNAVKETLHRKLYPGAELKGSDMDIKIKKYFYKRAESIRFSLFSMTLNKRRVYDALTKEKARVYNYVARLVLDKIPFEKAVSRVELIVDKSKSKPEIRDFNQYIINQLKGRLDPKVPLDIYHYVSHENLGLQAVDLFSWGFFRKYEKKDLEWFDVFKKKVVFDDLYLK